MLLIPFLFPWRERERQGWERGRLVRTERAG